MVTACNTLTIKNVPSPPPSAHLLLELALLVVREIVAGTAPEHRVLAVILTLGHKAADHPRVALLLPVVHVVVLLHLGLDHLGIVQVLITAIM